MENLRLTVGKLKRLIVDLPDEALVRGYEGECNCIVIESKDNECDLLTIKTEYSV